jgi:hypothetical protein
MRSRPSWLHRLDLNVAHGGAQGRAFSLADPVRYAVRNKLAEA